MNSCFIDKSRACKISVKRYLFYCLYLVCTKFKSCVDKFLESELKLNILLTMTIERFKCCIMLYSKCLN